LGGAASCRGGVKKARDERYPLAKFSEIIERVEYVRRAVGLNKSRYSGEIGMKPQTYNNFVGAQGSKPNIELVHGVASRFNVNPTWLLFNKGTAFLDQENAPSELPTGIRRRSSGVTEAGTEFFSQRPAEGLSELRNLDALESVIQEMKEGLRQVETRQFPLLEGLANILRKFFEIDPAGATREVDEFIQKLKGSLRDSG